MLNKDVSEEQFGENAITSALVECSKVTDEETGNLDISKDEIIQTATLCFIVLQPIISSVSLW